MAGVEDSAVLENQNILPASEHSSSLGFYAFLASTSLPVLKSFLLHLVFVPQEGVISSLSSK